MGYRILFVILILGILWCFKKFFTNLKYNRLLRKYDKLSKEFSELAGPMKAEEFENNQYAKDLQKQIKQLQIEIELMDNNFS